MRIKSLKMKCVVDLAEFAVVLICCLEHNIFLCLYLS